MRVNRQDLFLWREFGVTTFTKIIMPPGLHGRFHESEPSWKNRHKCFSCRPIPSWKTAKPKGKFHFSCVSVPPRKWCQIHRFVSQENKFNSLEFMLYHEGPCYINKKMPIDVLSVASHTQIYPTQRSITYISGHHELLQTAVRPLISWNQLAAVHQGLQM